MDEQRKYAILFAATILAARKLNEGGSTAWAVHVAITDAISNAEPSAKRLTLSDGLRERINFRIASFPTEIAWRLCRVNYFRPATGLFKREPQLLREAKYNLFAE